MLKIKRLLIALMFILPIAACEDEGPGEQFGERVDETGEAAREGAEELGDRGREGAEQAGARMREGAEDVRDRFSDDTDTSGEDNP